MKKNVGCRVRLRPGVIRSDHFGRILPSTDDVWTIDGIADSGIRISNQRTGHSTILGKDHVYNFTTDPDRSKAGLPHGFLVLRIQITLSGRDLTITPCLRPGEPVLPRVPEEIDRIVPLGFPTESGLQQRLEAQGFELRWSAERNLGRDIELGWSLVEILDEQGRIVHYRSTGGDQQTLIQRVRK